LFSSVFPPFDLKSSPRPELLMQAGIKKYLKEKSGNKVSKKIF
jgi:hypothetical protein